MKENAMTEQIVTEEKKPTSRCRKGAYTIVFLFLLVGVLSFIAFNYYIKLNKELAEIKSQLNTSQMFSMTSQASLTEMKHTLEKSETRFSEQEQMLSEWRAAQNGDVGKWRVAEAQYLIKLADDHLQLSHNQKMAITLLQQAEKTLQNTQDSNLLEIRKAIANDLANLQALPQIDTTSLYLRLSALNEQIDKLPFPASPLAPDEAQNIPTPIAKDLPWWKAALEYTRQGLNKIVIVRKTGSDNLPLVMPDEKLFLVQNLHVQMESAMWALLQQNAEIYQASLMRATNWVQQYFAQNAQETKSMIENLEEAKKVDIKPISINLANTLQLFDQYFAQVNKPQ